MSTMNAPANAPAGKASRRPSQGRVGRFVAVLGLVLALLALALSVTIPFTMPNIALVVVRTGAAELSLWFLGLAVLAAALSVLALRHSMRSLRRVATVALVCSIMACGFAIVPFVQLPGAISHADAAMLEGLGAGYASYQAKLSPQIARMLRPAPFSFSDYFLGVRVPSVRVTRDAVYRTVAGHALLLDRYEPADTVSTSGEGGTHPGLLVIHGGSWRNGDKGEYTGASFYFASRGYVVYDIQYRLSAEARFPAQLEDAECALGYMRSHASEDHLDPERVVVSGRSAGAHLALLVAYRAGRDPVPGGCGQPARVAGVVAFYAPTDLSNDYRNPAQPDVINAQQVISDFLGGSPEQVPAQYAGATPQHWLDRPVPPTLLLQGEADQIVLSHNSTDLATPSRAAGNKVVSITFPWAGHGYDGIFRGTASQLSLYYWERFMGYVLNK